MSPDTIFRMCTRKVRHLTKRAAKRELRSGGKRFSGCHVYHCPVCSGWHIGHPRRAQG